MKKAYITAIALMLLLMFSSCSNTSWSHFTDEEPEYDYSEYDDQERAYVDQEAEAEARDEEFAYEMMLEEHPDGLHWTEVEDHIGENVYCFGKVMEVDSESAGGNPTFIDVGGAYPDNRVTGEIWPEDYFMFTDIEDIEGEYICMRGTVELYDEIPRIKLTDSAQIEVFEY